MVRARRKRYNRRLTRCVGVGRHVTAGGSGRCGESQLASSVPGGVAHPAITSSGPCGFRGCARLRTPARRRADDDDDACPVPVNPYRTHGRDSGSTSRRGTAGPRENGLAAARHRSVKYRSADDR